MNKNVHVMVRKHQDYPYLETVRGILWNSDNVVEGFHDGLLNSRLVVVTWNSYGLPKRVAEKCVAAGGKHVVMENGYFLRDRGFFIMARGGFNGRESESCEGDSPIRWDSLGIEVSPWNKHGNHILICGQRGGRYSDMSMPLEWPERVMKRLREFTDRPILYRPHPGRERLPKSWVENSYLLESSTPLQASLKNAHAVVTWTSNAATEALIAGVPVFYSGPTIAVEKVARCGVDEIEDPYYGDRMPVFRRMANNQWHISEISNGFAWRNQSIF